MFKQLAKALPLEKRKKRKRRKNETLTKPFPSRSTAQRCIGGKRRKRREREREKKRDINEKKAACLGAKCKIPRKRPSKSRIVAGGWRETLVSQRGDDSAESPNCWLPPRGSVSCSRGFIPATASVFISPPTKLASFATERGRLNVIISVYNWPIIILDHGQKRYNRKHAPCLSVHWINAAEALSRYYTRDENVRSIPV